MLYSILLSGLCFLLTSIGASLVFFIKKENSTCQAILYGFAGGVMLASSIFSLIIPAIDYCDEMNLKTYIIFFVCFLFAVLILYFFFGKNNSSADLNIKSLVSGIALHNIPEGMCVGFAFASYSYALTNSALISAVMIAVGIGVQNIPEGSSVSFPLYSKGYSKKKAFLTSVMVGFVEIPSAIIAYLIGLKYMVILPYMLAFSAAMMIMVACCDLLPEAVNTNKKWAFLSFVFGFILMMELDIALG